MDIKNLNTFIYVAELRSFTKAAQKLNFSQSTVSSQIKQLETELDCQLFERINHTVMLTQKGREVLEYAHQICQLTKEMRENLQIQRRMSGHVRLAMADSLRDSLLQRGFGEFHRKYPDISLEIISTGTQEMFRLLDHNEADAILTLDSHIYNTDYRILAEEQVGVHFVAPWGHPLQGRNAALEELVRQDFLLTEKGMSYRRIMDERLAEVSLEVLPVLEIGDTGQILKLVEQGAGISFLPDYVTEKSRRAGRVFYIEADHFQVHVWKQLLYHRSKWISPPLEAVLGYCISREFQEKRG